MDPILSHIESERHLWKIIGFGVSAVFSLIGAAFGFRSAYLLIRFGQLGVKMVAIILVLAIISMAALLLALYLFRQVQAELRVLKEEKPRALSRLNDR